MLYNAFMTKADKILIVLLMVTSLLLFIPILNNAPASNTAVVTVSNEEVLRIDLSQDKEYEVNGTNGKVHIEVKDNQVRVTQENSPQHICSKQGFVSDPNVPIVCLPNDTVVTIEADNPKEDLLIQ